MMCTRMLSSRSATVRYSRTCIATGQAEAFQAAQSDVVALQAQLRAAKHPTGDAPSSPTGTRSAMKGVFTRGR